jgi:beta-phosphoglucomutase-like phosphatase (HAD superfamily)
MSFFKGKFKAVIFDMDGVIANSEPIHMKAMNMVLSKWGVQLSWEQYMPYIGVDDIRTWMDARDRYGLDFEVEDAVRAFAAQAEDYFRNAEEIPIVEGIPELLDRLNEENIVCGLGTASSPYIISMTTRFLRNRHLLSAIVSGRDVENSKPAPDIFLKAAKLLHMQPGECAVVEDSSIGIAAAKNAGMFCVGHANPTSGNQDLSGADTIVHAIGELL